MLSELILLVMEFFFSTPSVLLGVSVFLRTRDLRAIRVLVRDLRTCVGNFGVEIETTVLRSNKPMRVLHGSS